MSMPQDEDEEFLDDVQLVPQLDRAHLSDVPDERLVETVVFSMIEIVGRDSYDGGTASLSALSEPWRLVHATWRLWGQVFNGGLHQYFYNTEGEEADVALEGLNAIGCKELADVFARAIAI